MKMLSLILKHIPNKTKNNTRQDMTLTDWYSGKIKPTRIGVYERRSSYGFSHYSYWTGKAWKQMAFTPDKAQELSWDDDSYFQTLEWRGICR